jgi:glycosyltransferase involved in cell wall biosynthesis
VNILFGTGSLFKKSSGPYLSLLQTVEAFRAKGHKVRVIGTRAKSETGDTTAWGANVEAYDSKGPFSLHYAPKLKRSIRKSFDADVVSLQSVWLHSNATIAREARRRGTPYMITAHGNFNPRALEFSDWKKRLVKRWFADKLVENATCLHALNEAEYGYVRAYAPEAPICVVPNGIALPDDAERRAAEERAPEVKRDLGADKIFLFLGRLHPVKNVDSLIKAWDALGGGREDWKLVLAGPDDADYTPELRRIVTERGIGDAVIFVGPKFGEEKNALLAAADAYVLPSHSEGFPMSVLEAAAWRLPAVLSDRCNLPEMARAGAAIETTTDVPSVAKALARVALMSDEDRRRTGDAAQRFVVERYQWNVVVEQLIDVFRWMRGEIDPPPTLRLP